MAGLLPASAVLVAVHGISWSEPAVAPLGEPETYTNRSRNVVLQASRYSKRNRYLPAAVMPAMVQESLGVVPLRTAVTPVEMGPVTSVPFLVRPFVLVIPEKVIRAVVVVAPQANC